MPDDYSQILRLYMFGTPTPPPWLNPRKGRDQILSSGNLVTTTIGRGRRERNPFPVLIFEIAGSHSLRRRGCPFSRLARSVRRPGAGGRGQRTCVWVTGSSRPNPTQPSPPFCTPRQGMGFGTECYASIRRGAGYANEDEVTRLLGSQKHVLHSRQM